MLTCNLQHDRESAICDEPSCTRHFGAFTRRHHCRRCGNIFCALHSRHTVPLDQDANYNPNAAPSPSRSCGHCFAEFRAWSSRNSSRSSSQSASAAGAVPTSPVAVGGKLLVGRGAAAAAEAAASVPRDWNWSTF